MDSSRFWTAGILVAAVVIFGAILAANSGTHAPAPTAAVTDDQANILTIKETDHVRGKSDAPVTLIEYGDFQCPGCASYEPQVQQLVKDFPDTLRVVFRHFPLAQHANAELMARAAEAATKQGKFWELHDLIYAKQDEWSASTKATELVTGYAREAGVPDLEQFQRDLYADDVTNAIARGKGEAKALNAPGTPTFFLNGQPLQNPRSYDEFKAAITNATPR